MQCLFLVTDILQSNSAPASYSSSSTSSTTSSPFSSPASSNISLLSSPESSASSLSVSNSPRPIHLSISLPQYVHENWINADTISPSSSSMMIQCNIPRDLSRAISKTEIVDAQTLGSLGCITEWDNIREAGFDVTRGEYQHETKLLPETWDTFIRSSSQSFSKCK
jgi:hypothetical protein